MRFDKKGQGLFSGNFEPLAMSVLNRRKQTNGKRPILPILCGIVPYGPSETPQGHTFTLREQEDRAASGKKIRYIC